MTTAETRTRAPGLDEAFEAELEAMALEAAAPPVEEPREPALPRYLKWQLRDFLKQRAVVMLAVVFGLLWIFHHNYPLMLAERAARMGQPLSASREARLFQSIVLGASMLFGVAASLFSAGGVVSRDREGGYQRFLFAKPVGIVGFYLQSFAVRGVGMLATMAVALLATSAVFMRSIPIGDLLLAGGSMYAALGGLVFLISTLVRFDVALALALGVASVGLHQAAQAGYWWGSAFAWLLPPPDVFNAFNPDMDGFDKPSVVRAVATLVGYGAAYVAAGVAVLRKRSIIG